jgi:hypothetical protein
VLSISVPCILTEDQRDDGMSICGDLIGSADKDGKFLNWIVTGDETWHFLYDPQLSDNRPPGNHHNHQERRNRDRTGQRAK